MPEDESYYSSREIAKPHILVGDHHDHVSCAITGHAYQSTSSKKPITKEELMRTLQSANYNIQPFQLTQHSSENEITVNGTIIPINKFSNNIFSMDDLNSALKFVNGNIQKQIVSDEFVDDLICGGYPGGKAPGEDCADYI
jgi:hypothetical protein